MKHLKSFRIFESASTEIESVLTNLQEELTPAPAKIDMENATDEGFVVNVTTKSGINRTINCIVINPAGFPKSETYDYPKAKIVGELEEFRLTSPILIGEFARHLKNKILTMTGEVIGAPTRPGHFYEVPNPFK
jgi:hypothetical protein